MKCPPSCVAVWLAAAIPLLAQRAPAPTPTPPVPEAELASDRAKLLEGVTTISKSGAPGPVALYSPHAFPLVTARESKAMVAVAAASTLGKGRAVIFGHNAFLDAGSSGDSERLLLNAVRWSSRKERPRVIVKGAKCGDALKKAGCTVTNPGKLDKKSLREGDVLVLNAQNLTDREEAGLIHEFVANGGGLVAAATGWAFSQVNGGQEFKSAFCGNDVLADAGLGWTTETIGSGSEFQVARDSAPLLNASTAIRTLQGKPAGSVTSPDELEQAVRSIQLAMDTMPEAIKATFGQSLAQILAAPGGGPGPSPQDAYGPNDPRRARVTMEARLLKFLPTADVKPHASATVFPGRVGSGARATTKSISIDPKVPGWQSTGLFADAGARIDVAIPPEALGQGYAVRIGCHSDSLYNVEKWKRMPEVTVTRSLQGAQTSLASPYGGLLYIVVPDKAKSEKPFDVKIAGGVEAPWFVLGKTTDQQWQAQKQLQAPWAELACPGVILTVPADVAREVANPTELMKYWQRVIDAEDALSNVAAQRRRPERIVPDVEISAGFMHSGYPVMIHLPEAKEMATLGGGKMPGWGFYHELGHNHQKPEWTFDGTGEVTCNIFSLYITEVMQGKARGENHGAIKPDARAKRTQQYIDGGRDFAKWKGDAFLALDVYMQLIDGFGWDAMQKVIRSYQGAELGPLPKSDDEKRDQWMVRYSKTVGKNLGPLFTAWGIPVSAEAKAQVAELPAWMPPGMK